MTDPFVLGFASSFAATFLYDISIRVINAISTKSANVDIEQQLKEALKKATVLVLQEDIRLNFAIDEIVDRIWDNRLNNRIINDEKLLFQLSLLLEQYDETSITAEELLPSIISALPGEIVKYPQLASYETLEMLSGLHDIAKTLSIDVTEIKNHLARKMPTIVDLKRELAFFSNEISKNLKARNSMVSNNRFMPAAYIEYFTRVMFLENTMPDQKKVTLKDVYIKPKFSILDFILSNENITYNDIEQLVVDFSNDNLKSHNYGTKYSYASDDINTLFIKGDPGSGKSSLFYYLAYKKNQDKLFLSQRSVYFIRLVELLIVNDNTLSQQDPLSDIIKHLQISNSSLDNSIIILDGLDEICAVKDLDINKYCRNLISSACTYKKFKVIITTRKNYINISNRDNKNVLNIQLVSLDIDDLSQWAMRYFNIHDKCIDHYETAQMNINLLRFSDKDDLISIVAIPLLFYMIVAMKIDITRISKIGELYDSVFDELYLRNYNENRNDAIQRHAVESELPSKLSRQIAREIALKMYLKSNPLLRISNEELNSTISSVCGNVNRTFDNSEKTQIERLFAITFFYRQNNDVVEFAHKSITDYFAAENIYFYLSESKEDSIEIIKKYFIDHPISIEVAEHIKYFFSKKNTPSASKSNLSIELNRLLLKIAESGDLQEPFSKHNGYSFDYAKLLFKVIWLFEKEILDNIFEINDFLSNPKVKQYFSNILRTQSCTELPFLDDNVNPFSFSYCNFVGFDFSFCKLTKIDFTKSSLNNVNFISAYLDACNFCDCTFSGLIDFSYSRIVNSLFQNISVNAKMQNVTVSSTRLINVDLTRASLNKICFEKSSAIDVRFRFKQFDDLIGQYVEMSNPEILLLFEETDEKLISESISKSVKIGESIQEDKILNYIIEKMKLNIAEILKLHFKPEIIDFKISYDKSSFLSGIKKRIASYTKKTHKVPGKNVVDILNSESKSD